MQLYLKIGLKLNKNTDMKIAPLLGCAIPTALGSVDKFKIKVKTKLQFWVQVELESLFELSFVLKS